MASSKREKELARQRAVRQAARNAASTRKRKQRNAIVASVAAVLLVAVVGIGTALALNRGSGSDVANATSTSAPSAPAATKPPSTAPSQGASTAPSTAATSSPGASTVSCSYTKTSEKPARQVKLPPTTGVETTQVYDVTMKTNQGTIVWRMPSAKAPCTANNLRSLAHFAFFDDTPCHRLTTNSIFVLQCGDPTGTGSGGPGYKFGEENLQGATYPRGTVAMARTMEPGTNGSQFFLVYKDSGLPPNYTPFGTIIKGLDVLDKVAAAGSDDSNGKGDGKPKLPVEIKTLRATAVGA